MFDVVIPLGPHDLQNIKKQIECTKTNVIGLRNIYVVTPIAEFTHPGIIIINECIFPFVDQIAIYHGKDKRNTWYFQQLIKLYSGFVIPGILDRYLVIDADTFFLKPINFINSENQCQYNFGREYHCHYFDHMQRLHPELTRVYELSGICHHMIFETQIIQKMMAMVEEKHDKFFWIVFLEKVEPWLRHGFGSGASEYELYFNYVCKFHPDEIEVRELNWENVRKLDFTKDLDYISYHHFMRDE
jgi:hypothetical protein